MFIRILIALNLLNKFLLMGACIYGAYATFAPSVEGDLETTVIVDANCIDGFVAQ